MYSPTPVCKWIGIKYTVADTAESNKSAGNTSGKRQGDHGRARRRMNKIPSSEARSCSIASIVRPAFCLLSAHPARFMRASSRESTGSSLLLMAQIPLRFATEQNNNNAAKFRLGQSHDRE